MAFGDDAVLSLSAQFRKVNIAVTATDMTSLSVYRIIPGDTINVRGAYEVVPNGAPGLWVGSDFEAPQGKTLTYGATISDGNTTVVLDPVVMEGVVDYGGDYIMPVGNPSLGTNIYVEAGGIDALTYDIEQDIAPIIGRRSPVVVSHGRRYFESEFTFLTLEQDDRNRLQLVTDYPVAMFISRAGYGFSDPVYLALGRVEEERTSRFGFEQSRRFRIRVTQVDSPPAEYPYVVVSETWQDRFDEGLTWQQVSDTYQTWYEYTGYPQ